MWHHKTVTKVPSDSVPQKQNTLIGTMIVTNCRVKSTDKQYCNKEYRQCSEFSFSYPRDECTHHDSSCLCNHSILLSAGRIASVFILSLISNSRS